MKDVDIIRVFPPGQEPFEDKKGNKEEFLPRFIKEETEKQQPIPWWKFNYVGK